MDDARFDVGVNAARRTLERLEEVIDLPLPEYWARGYFRTRAEDQPELLDSLISGSREIRGAWDAISLIAQRRLREDGTSVPRELAGWAADVIQDVSKPKGKRTRPRPPARGPDPSETYVRDWAIVHTVQLLVSQRGFTATRNKPIEKPCAEGGSACDAVGVAFGMKKYKAVERVWTKSGHPRLVGRLLVGVARPSYPISVNE